MIEETETKDIRGREDRGGECICSRTRGGSRLLLLPCNSNRREKADKRNRQKRIVFIIQRSVVFILVYRGAVMEAWEWWQHVGMVATHRNGGNAGDSL